MLGPYDCLDDAPLFWNCTAELVTFPVAAATGFALLLVSPSANTGLTVRRQRAK